MLNYGVLSTVDFENSTETIIPKEYAMEQNPADANVANNDVPLIERNREYDLSLQVFSFVESKRRVCGEVSPFTLYQLIGDIWNAVKWMFGFCSVIQVAEGGVGFEVGDLLSGNVEPSYISVLRFISAQYRQNEDIVEIFHFSKVWTETCFKIVNWDDIIQM